MTKDILEKLDEWNKACTEPNRDNWGQWFKEGFAGAENPNKFCANIITEASTAIKELRTMKESYSRLYKMVYGSTP